MLQVPQNVRIFISQPETKKTPITKIIEKYDMWSKRTDYNVWVVVINIDESLLVSRADFWPQSISGRPAGSRSDRRRSDRESSPHRSPHVFLLETLSA